MMKHAGSVQPISQSVGVSKTTVVDSETEIRDLGAQAPALPVYLPQKTSLQRKTPWNKTKVTTRGPRYSGRATSCASVPGTRPAAAGTTALVGVAL